MAAWSAWQNVRSIGIPAGRAGPARFLLPMQISPDADGRYADVRIVDERGMETPYAIDPAPQSDMRDAALVDVRFVPGRGTEAVLDLGRRPPPIDCVVLSADAEQRPSYFEHLSIDVSRDRRRWRTVRAGAIVYRVGDDDGKGNQSVSFPTARTRWLRVRVLDPRGPFPLTAASVGRTGLQRDPLAPLPVVPVVVNDLAAHRQIWTFRQPQPFRPSAVSFMDASGTFVRPVRIESNPDRQTWSFAGDGTIARYADGTADTSFGFPEDTAAGWRVVVENGDDAPLARARPVLLAVPHELVFEAAPGRSYRLLAGNAAAAPASYDLGVRLAHAHWKAQTAWLGPNEPNPVYRDPARLWKLGAWLLAGLLALALVAGAASYAIGARGRGTVPPT